MLTRSGDIIFDHDRWQKSCASKKGYDTEYQAAETASDQERRRRGLKLDWYLCEYCGKWHLTEI